MNFLEKLFSLKNKVIIVTGGSRGIGYSLVKNLSTAGATVIGVGRSKNIKYDFSENATYIQCDLTDHKKFQEICKSIFKKHGSIYGLLNAAGISIQNNANKNKIENFIKTIDVNLNSVYAACNSVHPFMKKSGGGSIINITSIGAFLSFPNNPGYQSSKAGLTMLTKSLASDYSADNIRVNNITPGYFKTDMTKKSYQDKNLKKERINRMLIPRWGELDDLFGASIFLMSDSSGYITGIDLVIDGGWMAKGL